MNAVTSKTQNFGFLFTNREMSSDEKQVKAKQAFAEAIRQASGLQTPERTIRDKQTDIQETLKKIKNEYKLDKEEWKKFLDLLCEEGKLSKEDCRLASGDFRLIPLGYYNASGEFVKYDTTLIMSKSLQRLADGRDSDDWDGKPIAYLDNWLDLLRKFKSDLAATGEYDDFSPIDNQINAISRVLNVLLEMI